MRTNTLLTPIKARLFAFVITSFCSAIANTLGRHYFAQCDWMILAILTPFAVMLFALSYIGFTRDFSFEQFEKDTEEYSGLPIGSTLTMEDGEVGKRIDQLFKTQQLYLTPNFKTGDLAKATGICRTYIST